MAWAQQGRELLAWVLGGSEMRRSPCVQTWPENTPDRTELEIHTQVIGEKGTVV